MKKKRIKIKNIIIVILVILVVILAFCLLDIYKSLKDEGAKELVIIDTIEGYEYELNENDSEYFTELFKELKSNLESKDKDEEKYAETVAKLFIVDFYSLNYAINKNDIGGLQFVYKDYRDTFEKKAKDTVYRYVENNIYGKRTQELPNVTDVNIDDITVNSYKGEKETDNKAYFITATLTYEKDLEYPAEVKLKLIHSNDKLEIAEME